MKNVSDEELQLIVQRVVRQVAGDSPESGSTPTSEPQQQEPEIEEPEKDSVNRVVAIGADHGGVLMKEDIINFLKSKGYQVDDCGTYGTESVDYPDFAYAVAIKVRDSRAWRGIIIDGAGIGSCMAANKVKGIRAAMCYDHATAVNSREHNCANVLTLGAGLIGLSLARKIVETWLDTEFAGGRHSRRVNKIMKIEE